MVSAFLELTVAETLNTLRSVDLSLKIVTKRSMMGLHSVGMIKNDFLGSTS
jgi:hypothetical protein